MNNETKKGILSDAKLDRTVEFVSNKFNQMFGSYAINVDLDFEGETMAVSIKTTKQSVLHLFMDLDKEYQNLPAGELTYCSFELLGITRDGKRTATSSGTEIQEGDRIHIKFNPQR